MKAPNRDLLVLVKHAKQNEAAMERELEVLNQMLLQVETRDTYSKVYEVIDCNKLRVHGEQGKIMQIIVHGEPAFVFLNNKN